jgi:glycosyltransferase involved in cell wall biosynthesis
VASRVRLVGPAWGADKQALLGGARAVVLTSYSENFGNVVLEAMAAGTPAVVTPEVGLSTVVRDAGAGLVPDGTPDEIAQALRQLWQDPSSAGAMGQRGAAVAREHFTWDAVAARMLELYEQVQKAPA